MICQVTTLKQITEVVREGADAVIVQGNESGGHGASPASTLSFVPEAVDHVQQLCSSMGRPPVPIIAAGGISDARQVRSLLLADNPPHPPPPPTPQISLFHTFEPRLWPGVSLKAAILSITRSGSALSCQCSGLARV